MGWLQATLQCSLSGSTVALPAKLRMYNPIRARQIKRMLGTSYTMYLEFEHEGLIQPISVIINLDEVKPTSIYPNLQEAKSW